jgi:D-3-phosphoglycerate dehydrogenase
MNVLITAPYMQPHIDRFRPLLEEKGLEVIVPKVEERMEETDLLPIIGEIDGVICGDDRFTERVLQAAPRLKVISKWGTGIDSIDREACQRMGVAVRNTPNAFSEPVADSVLGYMLCFARRLPWMAEAMRGGTWQKVPGRALDECILGVIGVGDVGLAVVRRACAFGMTVLGNDIVPIPPAFVGETGLQESSLDEVLYRSDFISLNCNLNPSSYRLLDAAAFAKMKPGAVVINTARGPIVDESALIDALQAGKIGGAALDVFEHEPLPEGSPLRQMDNVMLSPHNANSSPAAWEHVHQNTLRNLFEVLFPSSLENNV